MILVDTSIWIDHLRREQPPLRTGLESGEIAIHAFVIGELMLGSHRDRRAYLSFLTAIPQAPVASGAFVLDLIDETRAFGSGIGYVDMHLIASALIMRGGTIWTRDKRLEMVADRLGLFTAKA